MRNHELELWARSAIESVLAGGHVEDFRVEIKAEWPAQHHRAARRLAGHANAARGEPILWLIGVDEKKRRVVGAPQHDLATWWPRVESAFDSVAPTLRDLAFAHDSLTVSALLFDTTRPPYVVTNAEGGAITHETPWRDGTGVRSARRDDQLKILTPASRAPRHEVLNATISAIKRSDEPGQSIDAGHLQAELYLMLPNDAHIYIPFHWCDARFRLGDSAWVELRRVNIGVAGVPVSGDGALRAVLVDRHQARIEGAARVELRGDFGFAAFGSLRPEAYQQTPLELSATIPFVGGDAAITVSAALQRADHVPNGKLGLWTPLKMRAIR